MERGGNLTIFLKAHCLFHCICDTGLLALYVLNQRAISHIRLILSHHTFMRLESHTQDAISAEDIVIVNTGPPIALTKFTVRYKASLSRNVSYNGGIM